MTTFDNRENAFENKYAHYEEIQFKAEARRNKLVGLWAAGLLGKTGEAASDYAKSVVIADLEEPGIEDVMRKLVADLGDVSDPDTIRTKMAEMLPEAQMQVMNETNKG